MAKNKTPSELSPEAAAVCFERGTEPPFSGNYLNNKDAGSYGCAVCGQTLFSSGAKYESGCGWPSFYEGIDKAAIIETRDTSLGMTRIEVTCANCGCHLGHVFPDGPAPTGQRYCVNSLSLDFNPDEKA